MYKSLIEFILDHKKWSAETFGPGQKTQALLSHIRSELAEIEKNPTDPEEWIDVLILALDGAWRCGPHTAYIVEQVLIQKFEKNKARKWIIPDDPNAPIEHDRSQEMAESNG